MFHKYAKYKKKYFEIKQNGGRQLFVKTLTGETITIEINNNDTVKKLKELILEKKGYPIKSMRLIFGGKLLLDDFKVHSGVDRVHLVLRMIPIQTKSQKYPDFSGDINDSLFKYKTEASEKIGIPIESIQIEFEDNIIDATDEKSLADLGITDTNSDKLFVIKKRLKKLLTRRC